MKNKKRSPKKKESGSHWIKFIIKKKKKISFCAAFKKNCWLSATCHTRDKPTLSQR